MFLIFKLPRSGSTMFGAVLNSHPALSCQNELLNRHQSAPTHEKLAHIEAFFGAGPATGGAHPIRGATMNPYKYALSGDDLARVPSLKRGRPRRWPGFLAKSRRGPAAPVAILVLERANKLKQALSVYLSQERGSWESSLGGIKDKTALARRRFDLPRLRGLVQDLEAQAEGLTAIASRLSAGPLQVTYEDLVTQPAATYGRVFAHIGAPPVDADFDFTAGFTKIASDDLRELVENYDQLAADPALARYLSP